MITGTYPGIEVYFTCSICGADAMEELSQFSALKFTPLPKGWLWVLDRGYCDLCKRYAGVDHGPRPEQTLEQAKTEVAQTKKQLDDMLVLAHRNLMLWNEVLELKEKLKVSNREVGLG